MARMFLSPHFHEHSIETIGSLRASHKEIFGVHAYLFSHLRNNLFTSVLTMIYHQKH